MFAKFSFYLAFAVLVSSVLALSKEHRDNEISEEHDHHSGDDHGHDDGHDHDHHHHHHGGNETRHGTKGEECHMKLNPDSPFMKVKNLSEALYTEFFVIASGDNYESPQVSNDVHVNARAIVLFSQNLTYMPQAYMVIFNVTSTYALKGASVDGKDTMTLLINDLTAQFRTRGGETFSDSFKSNVTDSFIARGKYFKAGATPQEQAEAYDKWLRDPFVGAAAMHRLFLRAAWRKDKPPYNIYHAVANYVLDRNVFLVKAGDDKSEKLQNIYATAIAKTVQTVCPAHEPHKAGVVFYQNLMELLSEDADLLVTLYSDAGMAPGVMYYDKPF